MKTEREYLEHIRECIEAIERYTLGGRAVFDDPKTQDAVIRRLQIMAESCLRLSDETQTPILKWAGSTYAASATASFMNIWTLILN